MTENNDFVSPVNPAPADPTGIDFLHLYAALMKRLWLVGVVFVLVVTGVAFWTFRQVRIYKAEASLVIDLNPPQVLKGVPEVVDLGNGGYWSTKEYFETQYNVMKSRMVSERVVARLGLDRDLEFLGIRADLDPAAKAAALKNADPVRMVVDRVTVLPVKDSRVVKVAIEDRDPQRAADLANAVVEEYIEQNVDRKLTATHGASAWLAVQLEKAKKKLEDSEKALFQFKVDHGVVSMSLEDQKNTSSFNFVKINDSLTTAVLRRVGIESRRQNLQELLSETKGAEFRAESFRPVADNTMINEFKREYFRLQSERAEMAEKYLAEHPKRAALDERIGKVKSNIAHAIQNVLDASEAEYRQVADEEKRLRGLLDNARSSAFAVNKLEVQYLQMKRERDQNQTQYEVMVKRGKEVDISGSLRTNNIRLLDAALVPRVPSRPNRGQNILLAIVLGLVLGMGLVIALELLDNTVKSQDDIENGLGLPLLGILPSIPSPVTEGIDPQAVAQRDLYVAQSPGSAVSECARSIRTSLLFASPDRPFKVLLIASTGPREGKTTTAVGIGITMAQSGNRVLIIDGDLRRPRIHRTFGVPSSAGLSTLILGESTIEEAVKNTGIERLFIMPAGPVPPNPAELLQSERYGDVIKALSERFDRIIIDSPPVGVVTDALVMSARADGIVLVLRSGITQKKLVYRTRRTLLDIKAHIYGAVLNDVDLTTRAGQYYYYYRYGYYPANYTTKGDPGGDKPTDVKQEAST
ncbi:MAG: polysaccharide biosynthesis tyrosine autokinase [Myxococcales bacterium]|nr:polysaccharide biosynthesis tyrosine autokinase [Myxococcales bacterium]